jgi:signal transduction histidine kinase
MLLMRAQTHEWIYKNWASQGAWAYGETLERGRLRSVRPAHATMQPAATMMPFEADSLSTAHDDAAFFDAAARLAAQTGSHAGGAPRRAAFLRVDGDSFNPAAEYDESGQVFGGEYKLVDFPDLERAVATGEVQVVTHRRGDGLSAAAAAALARHPLTTTALVPVSAEGGIVGVIAVSARDDAGFGDAQLGRLCTLAQLVGVGITHIASDQALRAEAERVQALERLKGEFLNIAAHELRSPLAIITGYASMLLDGTLRDPDRHKALLRIAEKSEEMGQLITEMLDTARMEAIGLDLSVAPIDLLEALESAMRVIEPMLGAHHRFRRHGRLVSLPVMADRSRVTTMFVNLLDNAIKYSPGGGDIAVEWSHRAGTGQVRVTDQGIGISPEQQSLLFTRFGRLVTPQTSHIRGTGLGLYMAREIARRHGGDIVVTSAVRHGTTFTVTVPLSPAGPSRPAGRQRSARTDQ